MQSDKPAYGQKCVWNFEEIESDIVNKRLKRKIEKERLKKIDEKGRLKIKDWNTKNRRGRLLKKISEADEVRKTNWEVNRKYF